MRHARTYESFIFVRCMRDFFKYVLATVVGLVTCGLLATLLFFSMLVVGIAVGDSEVVEDGSVLVLDISGSVTERTEETVWSGLLDNSAAANNSLENMLYAIKEAETNDKVEGIYLRGGILTGAQPAALRELRDALKEFKSSGKFVISYADTYSQGSYYVCSVADTLLLNKEGMIDWRGLSATTIYYKNLLEKLGVKVQVVKVGTYKSAVEPFMRDSMSEANREQVEAFCRDIWSEMLNDVARSRGVSASQLDGLADKAVLFESPGEYVKQKLADKLVYADEALDILAAKVGVDDPDDLNTVSVSTLATKASERQTSGKHVAVYYACGDVVQEPTSEYVTDEIAATAVAWDLQDLADDDDVCAVVLRVNSGGGSAYASEQIWHAVQQLKEKKPVVVSMGGMAASGAYYLSCCADWIVAEPSTLTGSIGIFGMYPDASELLTDKLGLRFGTVSTNKFSDMGSLTRGMTDEENEIMQRYVERGYRLFVKRCADGRKMSAAKIENVAEGRVWTGKKAKEIGLVDELGSLDCAVAKARKLAGDGAKKASVQHYPAEVGLWDALIGQFGMLDSKAQTDKCLKNSLGEYYDVYESVRKLMQRKGVEASMPYLIDFSL